VPTPQNISLLIPGPLRALIPVVGEGRNLQIWEMLNALVTEKVPGHQWGLPGKGRA